MRDLFIVVMFMFGLVVGSFLNVVVCRIDDLKSILRGRSHCPSCKHTLFWYDLVPLFSFIVLRARCRYCHKKISRQYPIVEVLTAVVFLILYSHFYHNIPTLIFYLIIFSILIVVMVYDYLTQYIPTDFIIALIVILFASSWYFGGFGFWNMIIGGLTGALAPFLLVTISKEKWMGRGDIEVSLVMGMILGFPLSILGFFLACFLGSVFGIGIIYLKKKNFQTKLAFAPSLVLGTLITLVWGQRILDWYLNTLL